jgi:hypothetical protein
MHIHIHIHVHKYIYVWQPDRGLEEGIEKSKPIYIHINL